MQDGLCGADLTPVTPCYIYDMMITDEEVTGIYREGLPMEKIANAILLFSEAAESGQMNCWPIREDQSPHLHQIGYAIRCTSPPDSVESWIPTTR